MDEKASNAMLVAIVAVVAVVGLIILYAGSRGGAAMSSAGSEGGVTGQAYSSSCQDSDGNSPNVYGAIQLGIYRYGDSCTSSSVVNEKICQSNGKTGAVDATCAPGYSCFTKRVSLFGYGVNSARCARACVDNDRDGYKNPTSPADCELVGQADCNDANPNIKPGAIEICGNAVDENCDGVVAPACVQETYCDGMDNNHDGRIDEGCDDDNDDWCDASAEYVNEPFPAACPRGRGDCNDNNLNIHPLAAEVCGNGVDEDCSGGDLVCGSPEICDNLDNDADGIVDDGCDDDNDNYCDSAMRFVGAFTCTWGSGDCNDNNAAINRNAADNSCDGVDQNCDGSDGTANSDWCDGRDDNCDGVVDGSPTVPSTCPSCTDDDGNNPAFGSFSVALWRLDIRSPIREQISYDACFSATRLNESICIPYVRDGRVLGSTNSDVAVDCAASGQRCVEAGGGAYCG